MLVIGIAGGTGSGKTTVVNNILQQLNAEGVNVLSQDNYYHDNHQLSLSEREAREGVWPLGSYGYFGIGTVFDDSVYHLFQSRWADNADLFVRRSNEVMAGEFNYTNFFHSTNFEYPGKIATQKTASKKWWKLNSKTP